MRLLLAGGGTAGHVNPLLATAAEARRRDPDTAVHVLGVATGLEADLVPAAGYDISFIPRARLPRSPSVEWLSLPTHLMQAVRAAERTLDQFAPDVVVGFGGYVSTPAYRAAFRRGIPVVVHEANARPGLANRYGARRAAVVALTFPSTALAATRGRTVRTGLPLRAAVRRLVELRSSGQAAFARAEGARALGLDPHLPTLLITGGSLGALSLNQAASGAVAQLAAAGQVLHLTGKGKSEPVLAAVAAAGSPPTYHVREYLPEMEHALAASDVVLSRAGAGTVSELGALGIPALYVPLPIGNGEQRLNAADVVAAGGGLLVEDKELSPALLTSRLVPLLRDPQAARAMGRRAAAVTPSDGAARLVDEIEAL